MEEASASTLPKLIFPGPLCLSGVCNETLNNGKAEPWRLVGLLYNDYSGFRRKDLSVSSSRNSLPKPSTIVMLFANNAAAGESCGVG